MKRIFQTYILMASVLNETYAATSAQDTETPMEFAKKIYSYSAGIFEQGKFNGEYLPDKQCALMREIFLENLLIRKDSSQSCRISQSMHSVPVRYPGADAEDFREHAGPGQMPKPKLRTLALNGYKASISAESEFGKTIFFLTKTNEGWRVENALHYEHIPTKTNGCHGEFLRDATPAQLKYRPACQEY